jgi:hypothetical protein
MNIASAIERIVEIQRVPHGGIDQGCLWRRHLPSKQDGLLSSRPPQCFTSRSTRRAGRNASPNIAPRVSRISRLVAITASAAG